MPGRPVKFIWGASEVIRGRWILGLIGFYERRKGGLEGGIAISVRGVLAWSCVMAVVGWVALATAGFWIWQRNPYTLLTYSDALCYPFRRAAITGKQGQAFNAQGLDLWRAQKWQESGNLLQLGLARFPGDDRARLTLAKYYQLTNQRSLAVQTLTEVLADDYPGRAYLELLFNLSSLGEDFEGIAEICARFLPAVRRDGFTADYRWLVDQRYAALSAAERPAEALALVLAEAENDDDIRVERRVMSLLALNREVEAIGVLAEWRRRPGADLKVVSRLEVRVFREVGRYDEMERSLAELRERCVAEPAPLVQAVVQQALAGREAAASAALADFIFRFGGFVENLLLVAAPLAETGNLPLLEQCVQAARARGYPLTRFQILLMQTHLGRGEWDAAGRVLDALPPVVGPGMAATTKEREWWHLVIEAARSPAENPSRALVEFLRGGPWPVQVYRLTVTAMLRAGRVEAARDVLDRAVPAFPASKWLQATAAEVKLRLMARAPALPAESGEAAARVAAETVFAQRLEYLLRMKNWAESARHIAQSQALRPAPAWLESCEPLILLAQVRMAQAQEDFAGMTGAARLFLNGEMVRSRELLEVAREFFAAGDGPGAIALAREIGWKTPDYAPAGRALREWSPTEMERAAKPELGGTENLLARLRAGQREGDAPGLRATARLLLTGDQARAEVVLALAREWSVTGDKASAELLVGEILRRHEDFPPARRLQRELNPAGAGKR